MAFIFSKVTKCNQGDADNERSRRQYGFFKR